MILLAAPPSPRIRKGKVLQLEGEKTSLDKEGRKEVLDLDLRVGLMNLEQPCLPRKKIPE